MNITAVQRIIIRINELFSEEYFKDYYERFQVIPSDYEKEEYPIEIFTHVLCSIYGEFLYDILKDYGAVLVKSNDHILIKMGEYFYDVIGINMSPYYDGYIKIDLSNHKDAEYFEYYKDVVCGLYSDGRKQISDRCKETFDNIRDIVKEEVRKMNGESVLKKTNE